MRALLAALTVVTLASAESVRGAAADAPAPRTVRVDVIATDSGGQTIATLTPKDFDLIEDGMAQVIDEARFVRIDRFVSSAPAPPILSDTDERTESARSDTRLFAVFLDEYHVHPRNSDRVRTALTAFLDETLNPQDLVVVMRPLDSLFAIRMTRDREAVRHTIASFEGRLGDYAPRNAYERNYIAGTPARIDQLRSQVTTSAVNALAVHLGSLTSQARKTLIVLSEGLPRADRRRGLEALASTETVIRSANRSNVSVYAVSPRDAGDDSGLAVDKDALTKITASTDGRSIGGVDNLVAAMRPIATDSSGYYLISYKTELPKDGQFHSVTVSVRKTGVRVRTRDGYWSPIADEELLALSQPPRPVVLEPARRISPFIRPWVGTSRGTDGRTRVTFVWEPVSRLPGAKQPAPARVVLKALAADGSSLFEGTVLPTGPVRTVMNEAQARAIFEAPPGVLRLRMSIENAAEQPIDSDIRDITVRDLSASVVLGTPAIMRARTARDFRAIEADPDAVPVASREFSRTERLMIRIPAYAPAGASLNVSARLLNRSGQLIRELPMQLDASRSLIQCAIDLPLAGFAPGEYRIEFAATSQAGEIRDLLVFRVTN